MEYKRIQPENEVKSLIEEILASLKSDQARKVWLTKQIQELNDLVAEIEEILSRPMRERYRLGEFISRIDLINARRELKIVSELRGVSVPPIPWIEFVLYDNPRLKVKARRTDRPDEIRVVLLFNAPRGQYYSFRNDAIQEATKLLTPKSE